MGIGILANSSAFGCIYSCPAGPSQPVPQQLKIPSLVLDVLAIGGVAGGWVVVFRIFREGDMKK
ncbi:MAG: hypothetical protein KGL95_00815 [Patescibacteria group bacterium]|nr:hypothetical protein [Patescibacteria group bacterium]